MIGIKSHSLWTKRALVRDFRSNLYALIYNALDTWPNHNISNFMGRIISFTSDHPTRRDGGQTAPLTRYPKARNRLINEDVSHRPPPSFCTSL